MNWISDLLKDYPALSVAKERLALMEDRLKQTESQNLALKTEIASLRSECAELQTRISNDAEKTKYFEHMGVLWKERRDGLIEQIAYCPDCKLAMSAFPPLSDEVLACSRCNFCAPFLPSQVQHMALKLEVELLSS